jgi:hypothetical protein
MAPSRVCQHPRGLLDLQHRLSLGRLPCRWNADANQRDNEIYISGESHVRIHNNVDTSGEWRWSSNGTASPNIFWSCAVIKIVSVEESIADAILKELRMCSERLKISLANKNERWSAISGHKPCGCLHHASCIIVVVSSIQHSPGPSNFTVSENQLG